MLVTTPNGSLQMCELRHEIMLETIEVASREFAFKAVSDSIAFIAVKICMGREMNVEFKFFKFAPLHNVVVSKYTPSAQLCWISRMVVTGGLLFKDTGTLERKRNLNICAYDLHAMHRFNETSGKLRGGEMSTTLLPCFPLAQ